jgi:hypothetical protein
VDIKSYVFLFCITGEDEAAKMKLSGQEDAENQENKTGLNSTLLNRTQ